MYMKFCVSPRFYRKDLEYQAALKAQIEEKQRKKEKEKRDDDRIKQREYEEYMRNNFKGNNKKTEHTMARKNIDTSMDNALQFRDSVHNTPQGAPTSGQEGYKRANFRAEDSYESPTGRGSSEHPHQAKYRQYDERDPNDLRRSHDRDEKRDHRYRHGGGVERERDEVGRGGLVKEGIDIVPQYGARGYANDESPKNRRDRDYDDRDSDRGRAGQDRHFGGDRDRGPRNRNGNAEPYNDADPDKFNNKLGAGRRHRGDKDREREDGRRDEYMRGHTFRNERKQRVMHDSAEGDDSVPGEKFDELSSLCDKLLSQQEMMQEEIADQANLIKQLLTKKKILKEDRTGGKNGNGGRQLHGDDEGAGLKHRSKSSFGRVEPSAHRKMAKDNMSESRPNSSHYLRKRHGDYSGHEEREKPGANANGLAAQRKKKEVGKAAFGRRVEPTKRRVAAEAPRRGIQKEKENEDRVRGMAMHGANIMANGGGGGGGMRGALRKDAHRDRYQDGGRRDRDRDASPERLRGVIFDKNGKAPARPPPQPRKSLYDIHGRRIDRKDEDGASPREGFRALAQKNNRVNPGPVVVSYEANQSVELQGESEYFKVNDDDDGDLISGDQLDRLLAQARKARAPYSQKRDAPHTHAHAHAHAQPRRR
jgi:hypothetical protein